MGPLAKKIVGTWKLVAYEVRRPEGKILYPFGRIPQGVLNYDAAGHMAVQIMHSNRGQHKGATGNGQKRLEGYLAYFGTYTVHENEDMVTHHVTGSLDTHRIDVDQRRLVTVSGHRLTLRTVDEEQRVHWVIWERVG